MESNFELALQISGIFWSIIFRQCVRSEAKFGNYLDFVGVYENFLNYVRVASKFIIL